jgi:hypothetical protein
VSNLHGNEVVADTCPANCTAADSAFFCNREIFWAPEINGIVKKIAAMIPVLNHL